MSPAPIQTSDTSLVTGGGYCLLASGIFILLSIVVGNLGARLMDAESTRTIFAAWLLHPGSAWHDSWEAMLAVLARVDHAHEGLLYQTVFFQERIKFQYPPTSLLPLALMEKMGLSLSVDFLNAINWVFIAATALIMAAFAVLLAERSGILRRGDPLRRALVAAAAILATLTFYPLMKSYSLGQIQVWINAMFAAACLCWICERRWATGMLIGAICLFKPQFGLFVVWALLRRQWPFLIGWGLAFGIGLSISVALYGIADHLDYLSVLSFLSWHGEIYYPNQSVNGLLNRLLANGDSLYFDFHGFPPFLPIVYAGTLLSSAILLIAALFLRGRQSDKGGLLDFMTAALTFTIASPIAWEHHFGIMLPILASLLFTVITRRDGRPSWGLIAILGSAYFISSNVLPPTQFTSVGVPSLMQSYLLLAGLATLWLLYRVRTPSSFDRRMDAPPTAESHAIFAQT
jgi:hypothetical protein